MKNINSIIKAMKWALVGIYIVIVLILGVYKFPNQDIALIIKTDIINEEFILSKEEIGQFGKVTDLNDNKIHELVIDIPNIHEQVFSQIEFKRKFESICVAKITSAELWQYAAIEENRIVFNSNGCELVKNLSESYLLERMIYAEYALAIILLLWILLNALGEKMNTNSRANHGPIFEIKRFGRELVKYREYIFFAAKADLNAEVANSYLNRLWWILEPFFNMLVYVIVFGRIMGNSIENYATYVFSGLLMWNYFNHIINYSVKCVRTNRDIVTKIYMPKYVLLLTNMVLNFIKLLFSLTVLIVMLFVFRVPVGINVLWVSSAYLLMFVLCFGFGMIFLHYGVFIDDLAYAIGILLTMIMFLSGIFYDVITTLTAPLNVIMLCLNPVALFVDTMRNALLNNIITNVPLIGSWLLLGTLIMYIGLHTVYKNENGYVKVI